MRTGNVKPQMLRNQNFLTRSGGGEGLKPVYQGSLQQANVKLPPANTSEVIQQVRRSVPSTYQWILEDDDAFLEITRETNTILARIPFVLWNGTSLKSNWFDIFQKTNTVPVIAGVSGTVAVSFDNLGDCLIDWTLGGNTDRIRIHATGETSYATMLSMVENSGKFTSSGIRYFVPTAIATQQFSAFNIFRGQSTYGGVAIENSQPVLKNFSPTQFQPAVVDVPMNIAMANNRFMVNGFHNLGAPGSISIQWAFFNTKFWTPSEF